jgi:hypothetical protein
MFQRRHWPALSTTPLYPLNYAKAVTCRFAATIPWPIALVTTLLLGLGILLPTSTAQQLPADAKPIATVPSALFASWFVSGEPTLDGVVKPADSLNFSNDPNLKNVDFYRWSEQMFLWLTSPAPNPGGGNGRIVLNSPEFFTVSLPDKDGNRTLTKNVRGKPPFLPLRDPKVGAHGLPIVVSQLGRTFEIEPPTLSPDRKPLVLDKDGNEVEVDKIRWRKIGKLAFELTFLNNKGYQILGPRPIFRHQLPGNAVVQRFTLGDISVFLNPSGDAVAVEEGQAKTNGVLLTQSNSLVYYMISVNDVFAYFSTGTNGGGITPKPMQFPTKQSDLDKIINFAQAQGATLLHPNALCIEVKTSWVETDALPEARGYVTMMAEIPTYDKTNPSCWKPNGVKCAQLALVGMHVVGSAKGHPEMIWATFEHFGNTPNAAYKYYSTEGPVAKTVCPDTSGKWLFCRSGATSNFNYKRQTVSGGNIVSEGNTIGPSDTIRFKPFGASLNDPYSDIPPNDLVPDAATSNTQIISINSSVRGQLVNGDIRKNYFMLGATWTIGKAPTEAFPRGNVLGTSQLANSTMETFTQDTSLFSPDHSCFNCHRNKTTDMSKPVDVTTDVSHIFAALKKFF